MAVEPGTTLGGRYRLEEELANGGMGAIWRAHDARFHRKVAIKVMGDGRDPQLISRFQREAQILGNLQHPGITVAFDWGQDDGEIFIVMELLEGKDLGKVLESRPGGLPVARTLTLGVQAAKALAAAHGMGVVHRDIKPSNLFVLNEDQLKICDFGIAKWARTDATRTHNGLVMGTPGYMSPEQSASVNAADELSDLYSLGCVMYEMLAGFPPFGRNHDWSGVSRAQWEISPQPLRGIEPIPQALDDLILSMLERHRGKRPVSASVVAETLSEIQRGGLRRERRQQRPRQEGPRGDPAGGPPRDEPRRITAEELQEMGTEGAVAFLNDIRSPVFAVRALSGLQPREAARLLTRLAHAKAAAFLVAFDKPEPAARVLAMMDHADQVAIIACIEHADQLGPILDAMPAGSAARLTGPMEASFLAAALAVMGREHALKVLGAMAIGRRRIVISHLTSTDAARALRARAEANLQAAERDIREAGNNARDAAERRAKQDAVRPWSRSVVGSAWLLCLTAVAFAVGAAALHWESWPWLLLFIPVALVSVIGATSASGVRYTAVPAAVWGAGLFLTASVAAVLLVIHLLPAAAGIPVVAVASLLGIGSVRGELDDEGSHQLKASEFQERGRRAQLGDDRTT